MKRFAAAAAALLLLTGCGEKNQMTGVTVVEPEPQVEEQPVETAPQEPEVVEIPMEVNPEAPMCEDGVIPEGQPADMETTLVEGLVEDSVGYQLERPTFKSLNGADKINSFYHSIISDLENFCKSRIYDTAMNKSTVASCYGTLDFAIVYDTYVEVQYRFRVEYGDDTEDQHVRNDRFDLETGEVIQP